ncbi:MAG: hypothetical protein CMO40_02820, partial [Verrucomicrobiaceae bacterium]|nr:hypothetical protein [Verrucomicrobiaceae bacterium]
MGNESSTPPSPSASWNPVLTLAWLVGALVIQVPFQRTFKLGPGNFGYNILIGAAVVALGVLAAVGFVRLVRHLLRRHKHEVKIARLTMGALATCSLFFLITLHPAVPFEIYWIGIGLAGLGTTGLTVFLCASRKDSTPLPRRPRLPESGKRAWHFNGAFWILVFLVLLTRDFSSLGSIQEKNIWESTLLILGRLFSLGGFTLGGILLSQALLLFFPPYTRWLVIAGMVLIPLLVLADLAAEIYWEQSLIDVVNNLTLDGKFDIQVELEAAGIEQSPFQVGLTVVTVIALAIGAYFGLHKLSRRYRIHMQASRALALFAGLWIGAIAQQALSMTSMRKEVWQNDSSVTDRQAAEASFHDNVKQIFIGVCNACAESNAWIWSWCDFMGGAWGFEGKTKAVGDARREASRGNEVETAARNRRTVTAVHSVEHCSYCK